MHSTPLGWTSPLLPCRPMFRSVLVALVSLSTLVGGERDTVQAQDETSHPQALVTDVDVGGRPQSYRFSVTVESPDTGCDRYADWWEVLTPEGELLYRRILAHSHVQEQPFTRSGGPVAIDTNQEVILRAHLHPDGYGDRGMRGSVV